MERKAYQHVRRIVRAHRRNARIVILTQHTATCRPQWIRWACSRDKGGCIVHDSCCRNYTRANLATALRAWPDETRAAITAYGLI